MNPYEPPPGAWVEHAVLRAIKIVSPPARKILQLEH